MKEHEQPEPHNLIFAIYQYNIIEEASRHDSILMTA